ncbi:DUF6588 family protein [Tenacibaculum sp. UWU-22]|uniref:DUF6588 family protein n=1 Tax=Tenacibaculum sp. UWU-22 TaxID=3234187 RepID=UPI0034DAFB76
MKKLILFIICCISAISLQAQNDVDALLAAGVKDAQRFTNDYLKPGTNGLMHSINANWFNTAEVKPLGGFEVSIVANASIINNKKKQFLLNTNDYNNVKFVEGSDSQMVATALGKNDPDILVEITYDDPIFGKQTEQITLPSGIGSSSGNLLPTAFIQGGVGVSKGIELKARFVPKIKTDEVSIGMYGAGLQVEITKWLPVDKLLPISIAGLVAYTHLDASYDLTKSSGISGENQHLKNNTNTWLVQLIASTKLPVINFYGGIGYISGKSGSDLLGTYRVSNGVLTSETIKDPFSVSSEVSAIRGTLGAKLKLGFFRLNAEYHMSDFDAFSLGLAFGFK